jgi:hypothetical protein
LGRIINPEHEKSKGVKMASTIEKISSEIKMLKAAALHLESLSQEFPALSCNLKRIHASIKMLELNFVDPNENCK